VEPDAEIDALCRRLELLAQRLVEARRGGLAKAAGEADVELLRRRCAAF
jgi:hypothetical protein